MIIRIRYVCWVLIYIPFFMIQHMLIRMYDITFQQLPILILADLFALPFMLPFFGLWWLFKDMKCGIYNNEKKV